MRYLMVILLSLSITSKALAQQVRFEFLRSIDVAASDMRVDNLNNIYALTSNYELTKYSQEGKKIATFSEVQYGPLSFVDPGNPMNILAYYRNHQNVVILDVSLSPLLQFNLTQLGFTDVPVIANSQDNLFWIFDNSDGRLKKLDSKGNVKYSSVNLANEFDIQSPAFLLARNNYVFLSDTAKGIFIFDNFGQFYRKFPIAGVEKFQFVQNQLIYYRNRQMKAIDLGTMEKFTLGVPAPQVKWAAWQKPLLFVHTPDAIQVFKVLQ